MLSSRVRSAGESRSMRLRSRSARSAWRRDTIDCPSAVRDNIEARPSRGSGLRSISPSRSSFATADVSAGCLICSVLTRSLSRHGPTLDRVCSTDSAEKFNRSEAGSRMNTELKSSMERVSRSTARTASMPKLYRFSIELYDRGPAATMGVAPERTHVRSQLRRRPGSTRHLSILGQRRAGGDRGPGPDLDAVTPHEGGILNIRGARPARERALDRSAASNWSADWRPAIAPVPPPGRGQQHPNQQRPRLRYVTLTGQRGRRGKAGYSSAHMPGILPPGPDRRRAVHRTRLTRPRPPAPGAGNSPPRRRARRTGARASYRAADCGFQGFQRASHSGAGRRHRMRPRGGTSWDTTGLVLTAGGKPRLLSAPHPQARHLWVPKTCATWPDARQVCGVRGHRQLAARYAGWT